jgi:hypothetical protein
MAKRVSASARFHFGRLAWGRVLTMPRRGRLNSDDAQAGIRWCWEAGNLLLAGSIDLEEV